MNIKSLNKKIADASADLNAAKQQLKDLQAEREELVSLYTQTGDKELNKQIDAIDADIKKAKKEVSKLSRKK